MRVLDIRRSFSGVLAKSDYYLRHICLSVRPSVLTEKVGTHWTDFHKNSYLNVFQNCVEKIGVPLKSDKNNGYFTRRPMYTCDNISLNSSQNEK